MTKKYFQLNQEQRYQIEALLKTDTPKSKIAEIIGVARSTVYRELHRNSTQGVHQLTYKAATAQHFAEKRAYMPVPKLGQHAAVARRIKWLLANGWSPEQISGTCAKRNIEMLSTEGIYLWLYAQKKKGTDYTGHLRRPHRKRRKRRLHHQPRTIIAGKISIHHRPAVVEAQSRIGDLETDLVKCTNGYLLTITERKTLFNLIKKIPDKQAVTVQNAILQALQPYQPFIKTITSDNGTEFALHRSTSEAIGCNWYFADAYKSQQRGINENQNGLIRQYLKNATDLSTVSEEQITFFQNKLNNRPRKKLNFDTPKKVFSNSITVALVT